MYTELKKKVRLAIRSMYGTDIMEILTITEVKNAIRTTKATMFFHELMSSAAASATMAIVVWDVERAKSITRAHFTNLFDHLPEKDIEALVTRVFNSITPPEIEFAAGLVESLKKEPCKQL